MATKAYILIETEVGKVKEISVALRKLPCIKAVDTVTGPYDIIAVAEGVDLNSIGELITAGIHPIPDITRTVTCLAIRTGAP
jgi:DNA-binding Lrp family transcriptional regulator